MDKSSEKKAVFQTVQIHAQLFFYTISIFRFIRYFKVPILFNRKLYVNMGEDRGGLLLLDGTDTMDTDTDLTLDIEHGLCRDGITHRVRHVVNVVLQNRCHTRPIPTQIVRVIPLWKQYLIYMYTDN